MLIRHLAIVSEPEVVEPRELTTVAAAVQKQVARDLAPIWNVQGTVSAFTKLEDVPVGYWPIFVLEGGGSRHGVQQDEDGQPYALVEAGTDWSVSASHEVLEMLVDPAGNRVVAAALVQGDAARVEYLVEICDPCEAGEFGYMVNGIRVSDFYTPAFFDPVASRGVRYDFTGAISRPLEVLPGGYLTWRDPVSGLWSQKRFLQEHPDVQSLGRIAPRDGSLRSQVDARTVEARKTWRRAPKNEAYSGSCIAASRAKAEAWRRQIAELVKS